MSTITPNGDKTALPASQGHSDAQAALGIDEKVDAASESTPETGSKGVEDNRTPAQKRAGRIQFYTLLWCLFIMGWNDGTTGPLLPRIREVYNLNFTVVSLVFVLACIGFVLGALLNMWVGPRYGIGKTLVFGAILQVATYCVQAPAPPFAAFVAMNLVNGVGIAFQDAQANGFVGALTYNQEAKMGVLHAAYGLGAFAAPLVSTQFAQMTRWSFHYLVSLGCAIVNLVLMIVVFRFKDQETCMREAGELIELPSAPGKKVESQKQETNFKEIMTTRAVHFLAFFILIYVGVEVTIGGWIVTFIIEERGGGPSSGYISSGFFGGLTLGRVILLWVNEKVGERLVLYFYAVLSLGLEFIVWFVPSLVGNAVAVSFIGLFLGPMFPLAVNHASRVLPRRLLTSSIGWIAGFGQAGSALIPFMTGAIAENHGIKSLHPLLVAMMAVLILLWWVLPERPVAASPAATPAVEDVAVDEKDKEQVV
ncbi:hypothetical protein CC1G_03521 [Coprinopsis cinerea okayama7|uniref:Major facilitator superfamily (MFS) profile domain-containing protein n=1 Tax=Coprinopsis cinerea (strain Okayama-7 / 130 / ATCC MYA-4618 / FGSC 9003) TaxID=240176 RepID=A8NCG3_COPC7|nr:hypothetical protein CC1G_03521 [Coprinopsis cinerea okayama7\|eukprot:XP_001832507.1 hypothetical protein CC1G_03521 [Coprinopsis cinerea okayama7\